MGRLSLRWKITGTTVGVVLVTGVIVGLYLGISLPRVLRSELDSRGVAIAKGLAERASEPILDEDTLALTQLVAETKRISPDITYALILDRIQSPLAWTFKEVPAGIAAQNLPEPAKPYSIEVISVERERVHDVAVPILEGVLGTARVGLSEALIMAGFRRTIWTIMGVIVVILVIGGAISFWLAQGIVKPILYLTEVCDRVSMGEMDISVEVRSKDEIGRLGEAFQRLATSLKLAMERLR